MVAERDHVGPGREDPVCELAGDTRSVRRVLPVDDAEVDRELLPEPGQPIFDRTAAGRSEDVGDEEESQRRV
jgi:hypothetical protein